jgi:hypothetical protein
MPPVVNGNYTQARAFSLAIRPMRAQKLQVPLPKSSVRIAPRAAPASRVQGIFAGDAAVNLWLIGITASAHADCSQQQTHHTIRHAYCDALGGCSDAAKNTIDTTNCEGASDGKFGVSNP